MRFFAQLSIIVGVAIGLGFLAYWYHSPITWILLAIYSATLITLLVLRWLRRYSFLSRKLLRQTLAMETALRRARRNRGLTMEAAAEELDVDIATYGRWERGEQAPQRASAQILLMKYGKTPEELGLKSTERGPRALRKIRLDEAP